MVTIVQRALPKVRPAMPLSEFIGKTWHWGMRFKASGVGWEKSFSGNRFDGSQFMFLAESFHNNAILIAIYVEDPYKVVLHDPSLFNEVKKLCDAYMKKYKVPQVVIETFEYEEE